MPLYRPQPIYPPHQPQPRRRRVPDVAAAGAITGSGALTIQKPAIAASGLETLTATGTLTIQKPTITAVSVVLPIHTYTTTFGLTENPMAEGGVWTQGAAVGLDWNNIRTESGGAHGTQSGNSGVFDDSLAVLKGTFGTDQESQATVFNTVASGSFFAEVELLLRFTITAHDAHGYEVLFSCNPGNGYVEIVKWKGAIGQYFSLTGGSVGHAVIAAGDVVSATIIGNTITAYVNGVQAAQATDSAGLSGTAPWTTGNPGVGHWLRNSLDSRDPATYGFSDFSAQTINSIIIQKPSISGSGLVTFTGTATLTIAHPSLSANGASGNVISGGAALSIQKPTLAAAGLLKFTAAGGLVIIHPSFSGTGLEQFLGTATLTIQRPGLSASGLVIVAITGTGAIVIGHPLLSGSQGVSIGRIVSVGSRAFAVRTPARSLALTVREDR